MKLLEATLGPVVEKTVEVIGKVSVATGISVGSAQKAGWLDGFTMTDLVLAFSLVGSIVYIVKQCLDIFVTWEKRKEEKKKDEVSK